MTEPPRGAMGEALRALAEAIPVLEAPAMLIGGFAVIAHGIVRTTRDIDIAVAGGVVPLEELLGRFEVAGFEARISDAVAFAARSQVLLLHHAGTGIEVDVSLAWLTFELEALDSAEPLSLGGCVLPVARAEDLVIYKAVGWRPRDREDVENLVAAAGDTMDLDRIRTVVRELAEALEDPERIIELEAIFRRAVPQAK